MKSFLMFIFLCAISLSVTAQSNIDVLHYKYEIELNDNNDTIMGTASIRFLVNQSLMNISFDLVNSERNGKGMKISSIIFPDRNGLKTLVEHNDNKVLLTPMYGYKKDDTATVIITYKGIPADGLIISKNKYGKRTFFADNWPNRAHHWIPCVDDPADKASVEFLITAPSHYQIISNGVQIEETNLSDNKKLTHYREDVPLPTKVMVFGAADFAVNYVGDVGCVPVSSWVYPENKETGFFDYAQAKDILAWHIDYIGPYAYKKLANVQSKTKFGGMENAGAIFYAEDKITGQRQEEELLSHEIVHQWFGNMATEKSFAHLWLSEGFATYLTHVYMEARYGTDSMNKEMMADRTQIIDFVKYAKRPVVDSTPNFMQLLSPNSYQKGGWVLHMLRRQLGDAVFKKSIRQYYATYAGKNAETKDLQKIFEMVSGKNLETFFAQWLHLPVNPNLKITWKYDANTTNIIITVDQLQKGPAFQLPLEIGINNKDGQPNIQTLHLNKKTETFALPASIKPISLSADPNISLLFEGMIIAEK